MARLHSIDNLRWMSILLLFPVHASVVFSAGWFGYYVTSPCTSSAALYLVVATMPWLMPLLFCVAGMSTKYALENRTPVTYLKERVIKLIVPYLAGLVLLCPVLAYYGIKSHGDPSVSFTGAFVHFFSTFGNVRDPSGFTGDFDNGHLWFILWLFVISVAALGVVLAGKKQAWIHIRPEKIGLPVLILLFLPLWLLSAVGPAISGYSIVSYFAMFLTGYYLFSTDPVQQLLEKYWSVLVAAWIVLTLCMIVFAMGVMEGNLTLIDVIASPLSPLAGWTGVLALLGAGRHLLNVTGSFAAYMGAASYPVYILHQPILVAVAWYVLMLSVPPAVQFATIVICSALLTFAFYEIIRKIPGIRALFGITSPRGKPA